MLQSTGFLTNTTAMAARHDPLDDALQDLRVTGSVLLHESYASPWAIDIPDENRLRRVLGFDAGMRATLFHLVRRGSFDIHMRHAEVVTISSPQLAICSADAPHRMTRGRGAKPVAIESLLRGPGPVRSQRASSDETELVCGAFIFNASPLNPLLAALPRLMTANTGDASGSPMLAGVAWMLAHEMDRPARGGFAVGRLLELLCAEAIRTYQRDQVLHEPGWFKGLADPRIAESIRQVHAAPDRAWSVEQLAGSAALSPSRYAARFKAAMGMPAMTYVARWRATVACRLLQDTSLSLSDIACRVGYESLPAFSRAFKNHVGQPPAIWRSARWRRA